jgi:hypothetical protein
MSLDLALWKRSVCCRNVVFIFWCEASCNREEGVAPTHNFAKSSSIVWVGGGGESISFVGLRI